MGGGITAAGNVLVPALLVLRAKGYQVTRIVNQESQNEMWQADKDGNTFIAEDTIMLLGVAAVYETRGERWPATDSEIDTYFVEFP